MMSLKNPLMEDTILSQGRGGLDLVQSSPRAIIRSTEARSLNIKICGIATAREAESALSGGADLLGFVFMRGPRRIEPRLAREIIRGLPDRVTAVGVFRNQPLDEVRSALKESGASAAQPTGSEPP